MVRNFRAVLQANALNCIVGDNISSSIDRTGSTTESQFSDIKAYRKEKSLEEQLVVLLSDMQHLVAPLVGEGTAFSIFLQENVNTTGKLTMAFRS
jgi:hypothetical protein